MIALCSDCVSGMTEPKQNHQTHEAVVTLNNLLNANTDSLLRVCLCGKTCDNHAKLEDILKAGYGGVLHIENENGEFVKITIDMLKSI